MDPNARDRPTDRRERERVLARHVITRRAAGLHYGDLMSEEAKKTRVSSSFMIHSLLCMVCMY